MNWASVITLIVQMLGPVLSDFLQKLLESLLKKVSGGLPAPSTGDAQPADVQVRHLFDAALERLPRFAFARRSLLWGCRRVAVAHAAEVFAAAAGSAGVPQLTGAEAAELRDAAGACEAEVIGG